MDQNLEGSNSSNLAQVNSKSNNTQNTIIDVAPNQTLYVNNLNEKIKADELKQALFHLFSQYGEILEIHAKKTLDLRGQAFIVFRDLNSASTAKHALNGAVIFGKDLRVNYSKNMSDTISKLSGQYVHKDKVKRDLEKKKKRDEKMKEKKKKIKIENDEKKEKNVEKVEITNKQQLQQQQTTQTLLPNNILFVENLPEQVSEPMIKYLFAQYGGFREVRLLQGKGIAFIEFDNEINAGTALVGLNGYTIYQDSRLQISFAKK